LVTAATAGIFYYSLYLSAVELVSPETSIPGIGVKISTIALLLTAPAVISFFLLAALGTLTALERAAVQIGIADSEDFEAEDLAPNLLDFVVYTTESTPRAVRALCGLAYPLVFTVFWIEAVSFFVVTWRIEDTVHWYLAAVVGGLLLLACLPRLIRLWWSRVRSSWGVLRQRNVPMSFQEAAKVMMDVEHTLESDGHSVHWHVRDNEIELVVDGEPVLVDKSAISAAQKAQRMYNRPETLSKATPDA
jgi:hypothetical protein